MTRGNAILKTMTAEQPRNTVILHEQAFLGRSDETIFICFYKNFHFSFVIVFR